MSAVLAKDGESLALLLAEGGEGLVALQARSKTGERSCAASYWTHTLTLPVMFFVIKQLIF